MENPGKKKAKLLSSYSLPRTGYLPSFFKVYVRELLFNKLDVTLRSLAGKTVYKNSAAGIADMVILRYTSRGLTMFWKKSQLQGYLWKRRKDQEFLVEIKPQGQGKVC